MLHEGINYDDQGNEICYIKDGYYYDSYEQYQSFYRDWQNKKATCKKYAEKILKCYELEKSTAVMCELFSSVSESVVFTQKQLSDASTLTSAINEIKMKETAELIDSLYDEMNDETTKCKEALAELEIVSEALKKAGKKYTELHNTAYEKYVEACYRIHVDIEDFTGGVTL